LWKELREGVIADIKSMISMYTANILNLKDPDEKRHLEAIIHECHSNILKIKAEMKL